MNYYIRINVKWFEEYFCVRVLTDLSWHLHSLFIINFIRKYVLDHLKILKMKKKWFMYIAAITKATLNITFSSVQTPLLSLLNDNVKACCAQDFLPILWAEILIFSSCENCFVKHTLSFKFNVYTYLHIFNWISIRKLRRQP